MLKKLIVTTAAAVSVCSTRWSGMGRHELRRCRHRFWWYPRRSRRHSRVGSQRRREVAGFGAGCRYGRLFQGSG